MSVIKLDDLNEREIIPGFNGKFIHSENVTVIYWRITAGSVLIEHNHVHEQITNIMNGEFEFIIEGETKKLTSGEVAVIPSNVKHSGRAITDCNIIDVFYPTREDYKIELKKNNR
ncbi:MAG: cupin domain-containing protein [Candidatus Hodarchaeales archaeon]|jgi:quercetin dioxygenase-like cupin family protein